MTIGSSTTNRGKVTLSCCMIVKNEERCLDRCLSSVKDFVDEIIVVDTGSTDDTINIAKKYGAKVYEHLWENNFSKHRNQSISYATCDWLFFIDADEELFISDGKSVEEAKELFQFAATRHSALAIVMKDIQKGRAVMQFHTSKFFKRGIVHYEGIVHNQPVMEGEEGIRAALFPVVYLQHYGYDLNPNQKAKKAKRTSSLLFKRLEEDPTDYPAYFYLSEVFAEIHDSQGCAKYAEKYFEHKEDLGYQFNPSLYYTAIHAYMKMGNMKRAGELLKVAIEELPNDIDIAFCTLDYGKRVGSSHLVISGAQKYIKLYKEYQKNPMLKGNKFTFSINNEVYATCLLEIMKYRKFLTQQTYEEIETIKDNLDPAFMPMFNKKMKEIDWRTSNV